MSREIKFRGKRVDNGEWVYGDLIQSYCEDKAYIDNNHCFDIKHILVNPPIEVDKETVGQFTGLIDNSGKEVYEGDIVDNTKNKRRGYIAFSLSELCYVIVYKYIDVQLNTKAYFGVSIDLLIVGNFHDHHKLLEYKEVV